MKKIIGLNQIIVFWVVFLILPFSIDAADFFPDPNVADGAPNSLRAVITTANTNGEADIIYLQAGQYSISNPTDEDANATGDFDIFADGGNRLTIIGLGPDQSFIDGSGISRVLHLLPGSKVSLQNLTIQNGNIPSGPAPGIRGQSPDNLNINNCHIRNNIGPDSDFGGGMNFQSSTGTLQIYNSVFENNRAGNGSGLLIAFSNAPGNELVNVIFRNNVSIFQAALNIQLSTLKVINCLIVDNQSQNTWPGGILGFRVEDLSIINSTIANNSGPNMTFGQGLALFGEDGDPESQKVSLQNNIFSNPGNLNITTTEAIMLSSNGGNISSDNSIPTVLTNTNDQTATNILFIDQANGDYRLANNSPAINNGTATSEVPSQDLAGEDRIIDNIIDSGAFESRSFRELPLFTPFRLFLFAMLTLITAGLLIRMRH